MAAAITHIVQGRKIFDRLPQKLNWEEFVIGTSFPDIRYLAHIDRNITHVFNTSEENIPLNNSFKSGFYVHNFIDERRKVLLKELEMDRYVEDTYVEETALKLCEDVVMYPYISDWKSISTAFDQILPEEKEYPISEDHIRMWHNTTAAYISHEPSADRWRPLFDALSFPEEKLEPIIAKAVKFTQNKEITDRLTTLFEKI